MICGENRRVWENAKVCDRFLAGGITPFKELLNGKFQRKTFAVSEDGGVELSGLGVALKEDAEEL
jgi:hypothetical protein